MPDRRKHRGPHPEDLRLFAEAAVPALRTATSELSWLLSRSYPIHAALKLVGDRYALNERQRRSVQRASCSDRQRSERLAKQVSGDDLRGVEVWVDGFNVVTSVEAALSGGVLLGARDGSLRDMASMHGNYRKVEETHPALAAIAEVITNHGVASCRWLLDAPVSNSGRLKSVILALAEERGLSWTVDVVADPDPVLIAAPEGIVIASADGQVLDGAHKTWYLARATVDSRLETTPWIVDLSTEVEGS